MAMGGRADRVLGHRLAERGAVLCGQEAVSGAAEGVRAKVLALAPEQRSHLSELAGHGETCLSDDDVEDQIDAALRCVFVTVFVILAGCASDPAPEVAVNPETDLFGANRGEAFTPIVPNLPDRLRK
jgi:hypothetical protein